MSDGRKWAFKVVKQMRDLTGQWTDFPTAATMGTEAEARAYAADFAADQRRWGVTAFRIEILSRRGQLVHVEKG
jgi:hypothetical protein